MKKPLISDQEIAEFRAAMKQVRPLKNKKTITQIGKKILPKKLFLEDYLPETSLDLPLVYAEDALSYAKSGIDKRTLKRLKQGLIPIEKELDLHGMTVIEAKTALNECLNECAKKHYRVLRVIHGKAKDKEMPMLKNYVNQWLRRCSMVLAFVSASVSMGGGGVVHVLLKFPL